MVNSVLKYDYNHVSYGISVYAGIKKKIRNVLPFGSKVNLSKLDKSIPRR